MLHEIASRPAGLLVVKFGGAAMTAETMLALVAEVAHRHRAGGKTVLVHGGGPEIDAELTAKGIATRRVGGLRVTDAATLGVTEAVLCGTVNKQLVRACIAAGLPAVGISGQDGAMLTCEREDGNLGYVGKIVAVNPAPLEALLSAGLIPVVAPLGVAVDGSCAYNVNADTAAGALAAAMHARTFVLVTNVARVRRDPLDPESGIEQMSLTQAKAFHATPACAQSMRPKLEAAITAAESGANAYICAAQQNPITAALSGTGTTIHPPCHPELVEGRISMRHDARTR